MSTRRDFTKELKALLGKYKVSMKADDHWNGYPECGQDIRITFSFDYGIGEDFIDDIEIIGCIDSESKILDSND